MFIPRETAVDTTQIKYNISLANFQNLRGSVDSKSCAEENLAPASELGREVYFGTLRGLHIVFVFETVVGAGRLRTEVRKEMRISLPLGSLIPTAGNDGDKYSTRIPNYTAGLLQDGGSSKKSYSVLPVGFHKCNQSQEQRVVVIYFYVIIHRISRSVLWFYKPDVPSNHESLNSNKKNK